MTKTALITGSTSGIGYEFAKLIAHDGVNLVLVSRNKKNLIEQQTFLINDYNVRVNIIPVDLIQENALTYIIEQLVEQNLTIDYLINNAGFNEVGSFLTTNIEQEVAMITLHISLLTKLTKYLAIQMHVQGSGKILNVGSTGAYLPCPNDAVYAATKAYMLSFSHALNAEFRHSGISVTVICPGATDTAFAQKANLDKSLLFRLFVMTPQKVAYHGYKSMLQGRRTLIIGRYNRLLVFSGRLFPPALTAFLSKKLLA